MRLSDEQVEVLLRPIRASRVKQLDGMSYVEAYDIRAMMIRVFGFAGWSLVETSPPVCVYEQEISLKSGKPGYKVAYRAHMALIVHTPDGDVTYAGSAVGEAQMPEFKRGDTHDMALKSAESGALKRATTNLGDGFGLGLYDGGSLEAVVKRVVGWNTQPGQPGSPGDTDPPLRPGETPTDDVPRRRWGTTLNPNWRTAMADKNITVWTAQFSGDVVFLSPHEAIVTEKRIRILGGGSFGSDLYARPAEVNLSPVEALTKLQKIIDNDTEHAEWLLVRNGKRQEALDAQLAQNMENSDAR